MPRRILLVNNNCDDLQTLCEILQCDYDASRAVNTKEALRILSQSYKIIAAILIDQSLPNDELVSLLQHIYNHPLLSQIPVLVTADNTDMEETVLRLGGQGLLLKPYSDAVLKARIGNLIKLRESAALVNVMRKDKLTGLLLRDAFFSEVEKRIYAKPLGQYVLTAFDIDRFSVLNDQYTSRTGDAVLRLIATQMNTLCGTIDGICCRMNADNFALLYPIEHMHTEAVKKCFDTAALCGGLVPPVTFSIGLYVVDESTLAVSTMYDRALLAKASVKGRFDKHVALYSDTMRVDALREQRIITNMTPALNSGQFQPWFQPQYNIATGALIGAEALARWWHPKNGYISPSEFIPMFEQNGFIYEMDKYIWEQSCIFLSSCMVNRGKALPVSVNISRYDLFREDMVDVLSNLVEKYRLSPSLLRLEITESAFACDAEQIIKVVTQLVELGFTVEIDDFGSGYSSLNTLKDVPAQIIKLDMRFLEGTDNLERGGNIIEAVIRMARWLGMSVIAEGIETVEQARYLKSIGCNYAQGYYFARPMPAQDYAELLENTKNEQRLITLHTVENLDNNTFWDPKSMDTLIFNSYVGAACIMEFAQEKITLLRATDTLTDIYSHYGLTMENATLIDWSEHMDEQQFELFVRAIRKSIETRESVICEYTFHDLPGTHKSISMRSNQRVIAITNDRYLIYSVNEDITEQREAEQRERAVTSQMNAIMANINGGISAVIMLEGRAKYLFANEQLYSMLGYTKKQYEKELPQGLPDALHPDDKTEDILAFFAHTESGRSTTCEFRVFRRDGSLLWLHASESICRIEGISQPVYIAVYTDITAEKANAQKVSDAEQLQAIIRSVSGGIAAITISDDMHIRYIFTNDQYSRMFGYTREQFLRELPGGIRDLISPEDDQHLNAAAKAAERSRDDSVIEFRAKCRDGKTIWVRACSSVLSMQEIGMPVHVTVLNDITQERESQMRILKLSEDLQSMIGDMPGGYSRIRIEADGRVGTTSFVNKGFCKLVGMTEEEVYARNSGGALWGVHPDDIALVRASVGSVLQSSETATIRYRIIHKDGGYVWVSATARCSCDESGNRFLNVYYSLPTEQERRDLTIREAMPLILNATMEFSNDIVFAKDTECRAVCCSPALAQAAGQADASGIIGKTDFDIYPPEVAKQYRQDDIALLSGGKPIIEYMEPIPSNDGIEHYASTSKYILRDSAGEVLGIYGIGRDITDVRQAYNRLTLLTDSIPGGIASYVLSPGGVRLSYGNDGFYRMHGGTREDYEALTRERDCISLVFPEDQAFLRTQVDALLRDGTPIDCTYRYIRLDGSGIIWINLRGALTGRKDDMAFANGVLFDVTERYTSEQKLLEADSKLRFLNDVSRDLLAQPEITPSIDRMLHKILDHFGGTRAYIFEKDAGGDTTSNTYEVCVPGVTSEITSLQHVPNEHLAFWYNTFETGDHIDIADVSALDDSRAEERAALLAQGIVSLIAVAFEREGKVIGFIGVDDPTKHLGHVGQLRALGDYLGVMLLRRDYTAKIEQDRNTLREREEQFRIASNLCGTVIGRYDFHTNVLSHNSPVLYGIGFPSQISDAPQSLVDAGFIAPESAHRLMDFYGRLRRGDATGAVDILCKLADGAFHWCRAQASVIFGEDGLPAQAVTVATEISEQLEKEAVYRKWAQFVSAKSPADYTLFRCNLNRNTSYDTVQGNLLTIRFETDENQMFNDVTLLYAQQCVHPDDRAKYIPLLNADTLLASYYRGGRIKQLTYREMQEGGTSRRLTVTIEMVESQSSTEVEAFLLYERTDRKKEDRLLKNERSDLDPLTGVLISDAFAERLSQPEHTYLSQPQRVFLLLSIDGFRQFGDAAGQAAGDHALVTLANAVRAILRPCDLLGRLGDAFMICLMYIPDDDAAGKKAQQIAQTVRSACSADMPVTVSIGIAVSPRDGSEFHVLYDKASAARRTVKKSAKARFAFYDPKMQLQK